MKLSLLGKYLSIFLVPCCILSPASARLGETEAQSKQRYGEPSKTYEGIFKVSPLIDGTVCHAYTYQGWLIKCAFVEGKAARVVYSKLIEKDVKVKIQDDELLAILDGEAGGGKWQSKSSKPSNVGEFVLGPLVQFKGFINTNGSTAQMDPSRLQVVLESPAAAAFIKARDEAKEQKRKATIPKF